MNTIIPKYNLNYIKNTCNVSISYVSLINPFILTNYTFENYKRYASLKPNQKIYVKQSYMLLTWFYYLNFISKKTTKYEKNFNSLKFLITPKLKRKFTITKAPIAHKTRSKEQILFTFFKFKVLFTLSNLSHFKEYSSYTSIDQTLLSILLTKKTICFNETNLLFLQKKKISLTFIDPIFFSYIN